MHLSDKEHTNPILFPIKYFYFVISPPYELLLDKLQLLYYSFVKKGFSSLLYCCFFPCKPPNFSLSTVAAHTNI